jgi:predicted TIM-barrel fold metal-dependent hydrolase
MSRPRLRVPPRSIDSHIHIFDHRYPMATGDTRVVPDATVADYRLLQRRLGTSRVVVVQPSTYGTDNRCLLEALTQFGDDAKGIAVVDTSVTDEELRRMASLGVRGVRFNIAKGAAAGLAMIEPLSRRIAPLGWHLQIHIDGDELAHAASSLDDLPVPIVFDHMGRIPAASGPAHPAFTSMRRLLEQGRAWVKLPGAYLVSPSGGPGYEDVGRLARALFAIRPDRAVWGSDWPHPSAKFKPDDAELLDLIESWIDEPSARSKIFLDNPQALYGFST